MKGSWRLRSPALVLLLLRPLLASKDFASRPQTRAMNPGSGARGSPEDNHRLQRSTVPGSDPQRSNELLLLMAGEGDSPEQRHHVLYFPGDVQVTRTRPPRHAHAGSHTREVRGRSRSCQSPIWGRGLGGPRSLKRLSVQVPAGWKERHDREWDMHAQLQPHLRGLCVLDTGHCLENAD